MLTPLELESAIIPNPLTVSPDTEVIVAIAQMNEAKSNCVLVVEDNHVVGILTDRDVVRLIAQHNSLDRLVMQQVMVHPVMTLRQTAFTDLFSLFTLLQQHHIRHLPILNEQDCLVGLVNYDSFLAIALQQATICQQLQKELSERQTAEAHYRALITALPDLIMRINRAGIYLEFVATPTFSVVGNIANLVGTHVSESLPPEQAQKRMAFIHRALQTNAVQIYEQDLSINSKTQIEEVRVVPYTKDEVLLLVRDISDRKQAELALQQSEAKSRAILAVIPDRMFRVGADGAYRGYVTQRQNFAIVCLDVDIVDQSMADALPPEHARRQLHYLKKALKTGELQVYEQTFQIGDRLQNEEVRVIKSADDEVLFMIRDISDRKQAERQLQNLVEATAATTGQDFFPTLVEHIAKTLSVAYVIVTEQNDKRLHTLAFWANGALQPTFSYHPAKTPCELTLQNGKFYCASFVQQQFPDDLDLVRMGAENYLGITLRDSHGKAIGNLCILDKQPIQDLQQAENLLSVFAARAAAELEREQATQALEQLNRELEQKIAERTAALQAGEKRYRAIIEDQTELICRFLPDGTILFVNDAYCRYFGLNREDLIGNTYHPIVYEEDQKLVTQLVNSMNQENPTVIVENRVVVNGEIRWTQWSNRRISNEQGHLIEYQSVGRDISDRKQYETQLQRINEELARATRLKDEFLANMSHELRTPLNAILGMTEGLQEHIFGEINDQQRKALQTIERSGSHLLDLINDILDVAKIESGQMKLDFAPTTVVTLCQSSLTFIKQQALKKRIQVEIRLSPNLPDLLVDERRVRQVLINLLNNAVKFTPEGGHITLFVNRRWVIPPQLQGVTWVTSYRAVDKEKLILESQHQVEKSMEYLRISIIDTGIGIASEHMDRLFQPFVQIDSALNRQYTGTGLGLALVKRIVELHGGEVGLASQVGEGSCFMISLPCTPAVTSSPKLDTQPEIILEAIQPKPGSFPLILLAEDNEANISTISNYLTAKGYRVLTAKTGQEAIALAQSEHPDLVLMDIQMPGMDGLEAIQQIRRDRNLVNVPIIALTALAMTNDRDRCLAAGANDYLAKPIKLKQLAATIQQLLTAQ